MPAAVFGKLILRTLILGTEGGVAARLGIAVGTFEILAFNVALFFFVGLVGDSSSEIVANPASVLVLMLRPEVSVRCSCPFFGLSAAIIPAGIFTLAPTRLPN